MLFTALDHINKKLLHAWVKLREEVDKRGLAMQARLSRRRLLDALAYLEANINSLIDYRGYQKAGRHISTGYVESSINRLIGRRICKDKHIRWSRDGAVQVRVALQHQEFDALSRRHLVLSGSRRIS